MEKEQLQHLHGAEAAKKIKELAEAACTCMMITSLDEKPLQVRPMAVQEVDGEGNIFFFSHKESGKNMELKSDSIMQLIFSNQSKSEYMSLFGTAKVYRDQKQIEELYSQFVNTWFDGKNDPDITLICFKPESGHFWDTRHGKMVQLAGYLFGAITGKQTDDGLEGTVSL